MRIRSLFFTVVLTFSVVSHAEDLESIFIQRSETQYITLKAANLQRAFEKSVIAPYTVETKKAGSPANPTLFLKLNNGDVCLISEIGFSGININYSVVCYNDKNTRTVNGYIDIDSLQN